MGHYYYTKLSLQKCYNCLLATLMSLTDLDNSSSLLFLVMRCLLCVILYSLVSYINFHGIGLSMKYLKTHGAYVTNLDLIPTSVFALCWIMT